MDGRWAVAEDFAGGIISLFKKIGNFKKYLQGSSGKSKIFKVHCATVVSIKILKILALPRIYTTTSPLNNDRLPVQCLHMGN